jgi:NADH-quinone oxidoreductase subunit H
VIGAFENPWLHGAVYGGGVATVLMALGALATWWERKFSGRMQSRVGPVAVGPFGILQPVADALKMLQKENIVPRDADPVLYVVAPLLPLVLVLGTAAVIPFAGMWDGEEWQSFLLIADLDIGILWVLALAGLMVFPVWMAGWSSNNKYTLLAGMRGVAQGISYEIPLIMAALVPVIAADSLSIVEIVGWQASSGWVAFTGVPFVGFFAFVIFFVASLAEANRIPFDIPEAESELVGGVLVEYTGIKFGIFMLAEYLHTIVACMVATALFLGGAHGPLSPWLSPVWFAVKSGALFLLIYWIRWSWYRFRSDQLMELCWHYLVPMSLVLVMLTALMVNQGWVQ